ncbi:hypothetical protein [Nonomuraea sp. NPDC001699]
MTDSDRRRTGQPEVDALLDQADAALTGAASRGAEPLQDVSRGEVDVLDGADEGGQHSGLDVVPFPACEIEAESAADLP